MANNSTTQRLQEKWEKITLRFFRNHANRQKLLETVAFLDESEGVLRSNNIPINRLRGLIERSGRSLITRNIRKITHNVIYAQYFICPPPFIQVERAFSNHVQYRFVIVFPHQFNQPEVLNIADAAVIYDQPFPITFEDLRRMPRLEFNLSTQDVPILKEVHLSRIIRLSILEPVSVLLNTIFSRGVFKGVTLLEEESINHVIPDFLFKLKTSTADYYLPLEIKLGNFDIVLENSRNGNFSQLAPLAAQCCSQTFTTYSPMSILITQKYIVVFQIPFDLERGDYTVLGGQYFDGLSRIQKLFYNRSDTSDEHNLAAT
ncbi:uncharacterized protein RJT21DRAFT_3831 [Scheffersomyces amazonensis]|uniref:uncharacterized protein n=1 Tax=Scheffersomyces amazonensis TaxID=1078765 RepID=UPI00315D633E